MTTHVDIVQTEIASTVRTATRMGAPIAIGLALIAALAFVLGITTPPRSGPFCTGHCIAYPYIEADLFFPRDYFWMLPAILLTPLFTALVGCLHFCVPPRKRPLTLMALCLSSISTVLITTDYFLQVFVVQPSLMHHEAEGVAMLTQYNPYGLFIALEDLGYLMLAATFLLVAVAVPRNLRPGVAIRWTLTTAFLLGFAAFFLMAIRFGVDMGLPFELAIITIDWIALIVAGIQLAIFFRRAEHLDLTR